jgi:hypothetical protein
MDVHTGFDAGALGFWIFIAAIVAVGIWAESRKNSEKHETLRRIMEKTGVIDEAQLKQLFKPSPSNTWSSKPPGDGYRALRVTGTIVMFIAIGIAAATLIRVEIFVPPPPQPQTMVLPNGRTVLAPFHFLAPLHPDDPKAGFALAALVALFGAGLFVSSRFLPPPAPAPTESRNEPPAH